MQIRDTSKRSKPEALEGNTKKQKKKFYEGVRNIKQEMVLYTLYLSLTSFRALPGSSEVV